MSSQPRAWVLNLDAEHELEARRSYAPTAHLRAIVARERLRLIGTLVAPGDVVLTEVGAAVVGEESCRSRRSDGTGVDLGALVGPHRDVVGSGELRTCTGSTSSRSGPYSSDDVRDRVGQSAGPRVAEGLPGIAWCPTPSALSRLAAAGATVSATPSLDVLRAVNARPFAALVRAPFARASFEKRVAHSLDEALALVARPADDGWLVRRTFGAAGRGRRRLAARAPDAAELAWLAAGLRLGPLVVEPWVRVTREYTRSAWVHASGEVVISAPCFQETTAHGAWVRTERAERGDVSSEDDARLAEIVEVAGRALARAGYFGPYGIDAYRHKVAGRHGDVLNPVSEINARFTMDWASAMTLGPDRGGALARLDELVSKHSAG